MIEATRLNNQKIIINAEFIEFVESTPDTVISLTTGKKLMVKEKIEEIVQKVVDYKREINNISFYKENTE